jgi:hypothetical protein
MESNLHTTSFGHSHLGGLSQSESTSKQSGSSTPDLDDETASLTSVGSADDDDGERPESEAAAPAGASIRASGALQVPSGTKWTEEALQKEVTVRLTETETIWLLQLPGVVVGADSLEESEVRSANLRYREVR